MPLLAAFVFASALSQDWSEEAVAHRLRRLELAWQKASAPAREKAAAKAQAADSLVATRQTGLACRALDAASAALEGRGLLPEDAVSFAFDSPHVEPGRSATLRAYWSYDPPVTGSLIVKAGGSMAKLEPGKSAALTIPPEALQPSSDSQPEIGVLVDAKAGAQTRGAYISIVQDYRQRVAALLSRSDPDIVTLAARLEEDDGRLAGSSLLPCLALAEKLASGSSQPSEALEWPYSHEGLTAVRAHFVSPEADTGTLVVGIGASWTDESTFFESYGRGQAVSEAALRGWTLVGTKPTGSAVEDAVNFYTRIRGKAPARLFVVGHSMGASMALVSCGQNRPDALVLFSPLSSVVPPALSGVPLLALVGSHDLPEAAGCGKKLTSRAGSTLKTIKSGTHLLTPAMALKQAFSWLAQRPNP